MEDEHEHRWIALSPSDETGVAYRCYGCNSSKFVESPRCQCAEGNHGTHWSGGRVWPNRRIDGGYCSMCSLLVTSDDDDCW